MTSIREALRPYYPDNYARVVTCQSKTRFQTATVASGYVAKSGWQLRVYKCPVCAGFHLTKRLESK